jgi:hypothetical protein
VDLDDLVALLALDGVRRFGPDAFRSLDKPA